MNQNLTPDNASYAAQRGEEQLFVFLHGDQTATFGTVMSGRTNYMTGPASMAKRYVDNALLQGFTAVRCDERWMVLQTSAAAPRRNTPLIQFQEAVNSTHTIGIFKDGDAFILMETVEGVPSLDRGDLTRLMGAMFEVVKGGWVLARISPEFALLVNPAPAA